MSGLIYTNGSILTMDATVPFAEAVGVRDGRIVAVGRKEDVSASMPDAEIYDLNGAALLPGFIDGHSHFPSGGIAVDRFPVCQK